MSLQSEFKTVDIILASQAPTRGVDAFSLALIKAERQVRKLFTHLVFQYPAFTAANIPELRAALEMNRGVYFNGFIAGIDALYSRPVSALVGADFDRLKAKLDEATGFRNKIFHGQLTPRKLTGSELISMVGDIRLWCASLGNGALAEIQYDGFARNSFGKSTVPDVWRRYRVQLSSVADYQSFIGDNMVR